MRRLIAALATCSARLCGAHFAASTKADRLLRARIDRAVAALPDPTRTVFLMHRIDDLPYGVIAERLGITSTEVEAHIAAAMLHLARTLRDVEA